MIAAILMGDDPYNLFTNNCQQLAKSLRKSLMNSPTASEYTQHSSDGGPYQPPTDSGSDRGPTPPPKNSPVHEGSPKTPSPDQKPVPPRKNSPKHRRTPLSPAKSEQQHMDRRRAILERVLHARELDLRRRSAFRNYYAARNLVPNLYG